MFGSDLDSNSGFASVSIAGQLGSELIDLLMAPNIVPGSAPGYQLCKTIYSYHPLGAILAEAPIKRAQGQPRILSCPVLGEERIIGQFEAKWDTIGKVGATSILRNLSTLSRVYGISSIGVGQRNTDASRPLDLTKIDEEALYFNVFDPLNTAGSLVLNQDPNSPLFLKQEGLVVAGKPWHTSRTIALLNEEPLFIDWSASAFGFVGRSVYQRALYPMKSFLQSMVTDHMVIQKSGLLVAKMKAPGSFMDQIANSAFGWKRNQVKAGVTNQVLSIGLDEDVETLDMKNLESPARFARENTIKNIASAAGMPASIIAQETLTEGFGEGTEDAKKEALYIDGIRKDMAPSYAFMDRIVMRIAWTREFYDTLKTDYPEYERIEYEVALHDWIRRFTATWPNSLVEPESEKAKAADVQYKAAIALIETLSPLLDPDNLARLIVWIAENVNEREELFASQLDIDAEALLDYLKTKSEEASQLAAATNVEGKEPGEPAAMGARS